MKPPTMFCKSLLQLIFSFTCFLLLSFQANAQQSHRFADTSAVWQIMETSYSMFPPISVNAETRIHFVAGDTVLDGKTYQIIQREFNQVFIRQDSGKVYTYFSQQEELLLYDFNLTVGDSFNWGLGSNYPYFFRVDSVDIINLGRARKRMFLNCHGCYYPDSDEIWVEGVGNISPSNFYHFSRDYILGPSFELLCYSENGTTVYQNPYYEDCYVDTFFYLSDKNILEEQVSIYPNPVSDFLFIDLPQNEQVDVCLSSPLGVELFCEKHSGNTSIDMRLYPAAIYLLQIKSAKGSISKKIVLER